MDLDSFFLVFMGVAFLVTFGVDILVSVMIARTQSLPSFSVFLMVYAREARKHKVGPRGEEIWLRVSKFKQGGERTTRMYAP